MVHGPLAVRDGVNAIESCECTIFQYIFQTTNCASNEGRQWQSRSDRAEENKRPIKANKNGSISSFFSAPQGINRVDANLWGPRYRKVNYFSSVCAQRLSSATLSRQTGAELLAILNAGSLLRQKLNPSNSWWCCTDMQSQAALWIRRMWPRVNKWLWQLFKGWWPRLFYS